MSSNAALCNNELTFVFNLIKHPLSLSGSRWDPDVSWNCVVAIAPETCTRGTVQVSTQSVVIFIRHSSIRAEYEISTCTSMYLRSCMQSNKYFHLTYFHLFIKFISCGDNFYQRKGGGRLCYSYITLTIKFATVQR